VVLVLGVDDVEEVVEEDEDKAAAVGVEYEPMSEEDVAEHYDSDNSEDDVGRISVSESKKRLVAPSAGSIVSDGEFHGPPRFAVVGNSRLHADHHHRGGCCNQGSQSQCYRSNWLS
jgi:hypothetical protein